MSNDQNDRREDGLFSDEYEAPKRENPYLKKNRQKSVRAEVAEAERAFREDAKREKKARAAARAAARAEARRGSQSPEGTDGADKPETTEGAHKRRRTFSDFMFEHVKLIAAVLTICVILSLVLITDVVDIVQNWITQSEQADKECISLTYVEGLTKITEPITWGHLVKFRRETNATKASITWVLEVEGTNYEVWISGKDTSHAPTYVYLYDMKTGDHMDLQTEDFYLFIAEHP